MNTLEEKLAALTERIEILEAATVCDPRQLRTLTFIARFFDLSVQNLQSKHRQAPIVTARFAAYHILRLQGLSFTEIGHLLKKDHAAVMSGIQTLKNWMDTEPTLSARINLLHAELLRLKFITQP